MYNEWHSIIYSILSVSGKCLGCVRIQMDETIQTFLLVLTRHQSRVYTTFGLRLIHFRFITHAQQHQAGTHHHHHHHVLEYEDPNACHPRASKTLRTQNSLERIFWRMATTSSQNTILEVLVVHTANQTCKFNHRKTERGTNHKIESEVGISLQF